MNVDMCIPTPQKLLHPAAIWGWGMRPILTVAISTAFLLMLTYQAQLDMTAWYSLTPANISSCLKEALGSHIHPSSRAETKAKRGRQGLGP